MRHAAKFCGKRLTVGRGRHQHQRVTLRLHLARDGGTDATPGPGDKTNLLGHFIVLVSGPVDGVAFLIGHPRPRVWGRGWWLCRA